MKKYFVSCDLEQTWHFQNVSPSCVTKDLEFIRKNTQHLINNTFSQVHCEMVTYDKIFDFFQSTQKNDDFILSLDNWIYIQAADAYFDSTRVYNSYSSILDYWENYKIKKRDGTDLKNQLFEILDSIKKSQKSKIILCDDWIFSGNTMKDILSLLQKYGIEVSEVRTVLNLSWSKFIWWIPIKSLHFESQYIDWIDERDLFYGTCMWGATFQNRRWEINWLPYIDSKAVAMKKASIPEKTVWEFCKVMTEQNIYYIEKVEKILWEKISLSCFPRISYLVDHYSENINLIDILQDKKRKF